MIQDSINQALGALGSLGSTAKYFKNQAAAEFKGDVNTAIGNYESAAGATNHYMEKMAKARHSNMDDLVAAKEHAGREDLNYSNADTLLKSNKAKMLLGKSGVNQMQGQLQQAKTRQELARDKSMQSVIAEVQNKIYQANINNKEVLKAKITGADGETRNGTIKKVKE